MKEIPSWLLLIYSYVTLKEERVHTILTHSKSEFVASDLGPVQKMDMHAFTEIYTP
jgi:hypothetical protein